MNAAIKVARLHLSRRAVAIWVPLVVVAAVIANFVIVLALLAVPDLHAPEAAPSMGGILPNALLWFLFSMGATSMAVVYPVARALGAGRRGYVIGTICYFACLSAWVTFLLILASMLESLTGGWFVGFHLVSGSWLGSGSLVQMVLIGLVGGTAVQIFGAFFGAVWLRFGALGVWGAAIVATLLAGLLAGGGFLLASSIRLDRVVEYFVWWNVLGTMALIALLLVALILWLLRGASIRTA